MSQCRFPPQVKHPPRGSFSLEWDACSDESALTRCKQACRGCGVTSEVLLMNLEAVVLGADSAVTITGAERGRFSQAGIEKIYLINESGPVAAMVYGAGSYVGLPWKTVLGQFRDYCGPDLLTIEDYSERLIAYLADIGEHTNVGLNENYEILNFHRYIDDFIQEIGRAHV